MRDKIKYKVLKDLPNIASGKTVTLSKSGVNYCCQDNKGYSAELNRKLVENNPEWFELIPPPSNVVEGKDWIIESFKHVDYGIMFKDAQGHYTHVSNHGRGWCISLEEALKNKNMTIFSVKRLWDNCFFSIRDLVNRYNDAVAIHSFEIAGDEMIAHLADNQGFCNIKFLTPPSIKEDTPMSNEEVYKWINSTGNEFSKSDTTVKDRIECLIFEHIEGAPKTRYAVRLSNGISEDKFPEIKQAIEAALNEDTVVEENDVELEKMQQTGIYWMNKFYNLLNGEYQRLLNENYRLKNPLEEPYSYNIPKTDTVVEDKPVFTEGQYMEIWDMIFSKTGFPPNHPQTKRNIK